jgi:hypothetical protein
MTGTTDAVTQFTERINKESGENLDPNDLIELIANIAKAHRYKAFGYFQEDDIEAQVWIIVLYKKNPNDPKEKTPLDKFDFSKAKGTDTLNKIEHFLNNHVKKRLANFYRDNYSSVNPEYRKARINLINTLGIDHVDITDESNAKDEVSSPLSDLIYEELVEFIEDKLPTDLLDTFHHCMAQENVSSYYRSKLLTRVTDILNDWNEINAEQTD